MSKSISKNYRQNDLIKSIDYMEYVDSYEIVGQKSLHYHISDSLNKEMFEKRYRG